MLLRDQSASANHQSLPTARVPSRLSRDNVRKLDAAISALDTSDEADDVWSRCRA
jgi:hypothetical protein